MMKPNYQSSKLYQTDLYDQIKNGGNHIICLSQDQTKAFILLAAIRSRAHLVHTKFDSSIILIIEPDSSHALERQSMISDHTELKTVNLFTESREKYTSGLVYITPLNSVLQHDFSSKRVDLVILDHAHLLLSNNFNLVQDVVKRFKNVQLLAFMCSLIHSSHEITPVNTLQLINQLEYIFDAKCETSSDLRSLSRQSPVASLEILEFRPTELVTSECYLLVDTMLKQFCDFMLDKNLDDSESTKKPEANVIHSANKMTSLSLKKQLILVRSCLADLVYSVLCLGLWCAKKTTQLYLTEFSRLSQDDSSVGEFISAASTILNCFYSRLDEFISRYNLKNQDDMVLNCSSQQLKTLLESIKEFRPISGSNPWPLCIIHVRGRVLAKVMTLWIDKVAQKYDDYSFMKPNYIVGSTRKHRNRLAIDNFDLHHEASVRDFRFGNCNILVTSAVSDRCTDMPRCNLVVSFDPPLCFSEFIQAKGNCRFDASKYLIMLNNFIEPEGKNRLSNYINLEKLLNDASKKVSLESHEMEIIEKLEPNYSPFPSSSSKNPATIWRSVNIINKYCIKLPSDIFTKLTPDWNFQQFEDDNGISYTCSVRLPINSPVRQTIIGPKAETKNIAMRLVAYNACKILHNCGELDDNMMPVTKESMKLSSKSNQSKDNRVRNKTIPKTQTVGSTKHRQYYKKRIAKVFSGSLPAENLPCFLYKFEMTLTCPLPEEQNRRGRRIIDPGETNRNYAIVCTCKLPKICAFPVFTRSGEVLISVDLVQESFALATQQIEDIKQFHEYTFSKVLRLEKYPTVFDPDNSLFTVLLAPVISDSNGTSIDWEFVDKIVKNHRDSPTPDSDERKLFEFCQSDYEDAVVIPRYRLTDRQQFAYYVAEICSNLNPESPFPDESTGFKTFLDYYQSKYNITIYNKHQPVLDVDHTSARLNLLTPRYVNRKGRTLPSSTAKTRRESRESLVQKQLLIPELCSIHPFPASFWRKAVCLPCIFYRLNSLYLAEELRRQVAETTRLGFVEPPDNFDWPPLDFGWSLSDVISGQSQEDDFVPKYTEQSDKNLKSAVQNIKKPSSFVFDSQPMLREIFIPNGRNLASNKSEIEPLIKAVADDSRKLVLPENLLTLIQPLETKKIDSSSVTLEEYLNPKINVDRVEIENTLAGWYKTLKNLGEKVNSSILQNPSIFEDNGIELIAVTESSTESTLDMHPTFGELLPNRDEDRDWSSDAWKSIEFDPTKEEIKSVGPGPSVILQALTMSNASDGINLERLETVGDSFLKYSITAFFYCMYPKMHEGKLSYLRSTEISNANLFQLGLSKNLGELMSATKFEPNDNWLPPGYAVPEGTTEGQKSESDKRHEIDKALAEVPYDLLLQHSIPDKSIADCVEALIGAYLTSSGSRAALLFMRWLGLSVIPDYFNLEIDMQQAESDKSIWRWLETPPSPLINVPPSLDAGLAREQELTEQFKFFTDQSAETELHRLYHAINLDKFEKDIGYDFKDKAYVVQAFTHNSFYENHVTDCYQRLEFLGDALLDYLITRYLFEDPRCHSPGTLTDLRSALVNNSFFASLAVKYNFHKYLMYISDDLFQVIDGFVKKFRLDSKGTITKGYTLLISEGESEYAEDIEIPKALGDVFESVAGAIYLDSGMSLDQVWKVYFKMMKPEIEYFSSHVPKSPIRELLESMPQNVRFSPSELAPDRKHRVIAEVFGLGRFTGVGRNKHSAKSTAAKRALRMLALKRREIGAVEGEG